MHAASVKVDSVVYSSVGDDDTLLLFEQSHCP